MIGFTEKELKQMREDAEKSRLLIEDNNNELLKTNETDEQYLNILDKLKTSIGYKLTPSDAELVFQYVELKLIHDKSWREYNKNPDRYIRIVTGICSDGKTPKVMVKENDHYKTWLETGKQMEKILKDLRLTPEARKKKY